jgi:Oxidoreductase family, NAD-binding Rossmann fold
VRPGQPVDSKLRLGLIGISEGNGHPYSWSAICNGYDRDLMEECGFPVIPRYLEKESFPAARIPGVEVTHVWTQDPERSQHIAGATRIGTVVTQPGAMLGNIDGLLLARDDAKNHRTFVEPFLRAGIPVYIDKPLALSRSAADAIYDLERYRGQVFSCSALAYGREFRMTALEKAGLGRVQSAHAVIANGWDKYAVHLIEPLLALTEGRGALISHRVSRDSDSTHLAVRWESGLEMTIRTMGSSKVKPTIWLVAENGERRLVFNDAFSAFRGALVDFVAGIRKGDVRTPREKLSRIVDLIQMGREG